VADAAGSIVAVAALIGLPLSGLLAALLLAARPDSPFTRWWALGFSLSAVAVTGLLTARYWWPDEDRWNGLHVLAVALAVEGFALTWVALRMPPSSRSYMLIRGLAALACVISACAVFFTVGAGTGK
jgi:hypothetical protein